MIQANPVLEAFGNAKTIRNDNSSRFVRDLCCNHGNKLVHYCFSFVCRENSSEFTLGRRARLLGQTLNSVSIDCCVTAREREGREERGRKEQKRGGKEKDRERERV